MKILLVSSSFYPQNKISVQRVGGWVKNWALTGHDVTVITTKKYFFNEPFDFNYELPSNVKVLEVDYLPKLIKKTNSTGKKNTSKFKSGFSVITKLKLIMRKARKYLGASFDINDLWVKHAFKTADKLLYYEKFDLIISSYSPPAAHIIAKKIKKKYPELLWIADFRDLWAGNHIMPAKGIFKKLESLVEKKTIQAYVFLGQK